MRPEGKLNRLNGIRYQFEDIWVLPYIISFWTTLALSVSTRDTDRVKYFTTIILNPISLRIYYPDWGSWY